MRVKFGTSVVPAAIGLFIVTFALHAEDWTTSTGKVFQDVHVIRVEDDAVTILYRDGGALIPLIRLPPELQLRFHYDPLAAQAAADEREKEDAASALALHDEKKKIKQQIKANKAAEKAREKALALAALEEKIRAYNIDPAILQPQLHTINGMFGKPDDDPRKTVVMP